ncbi:MAG: sulfatase, partial [Planctomycetota bacterium]
LLGWHYPIRHGSGHRPSTAIRVGDKKLLHFIDDDKYELYDLSTDLSEANDISTSVDATELKELKSKLSTWVDDITVR